MAAAQPQASTDHADGDTCAFGDGSLGVVFGVACMRIPGTVIGTTCFDYPFCSFADGTNHACDFDFL